MKDLKTKKLVYSAMFSAFICVATLIIHVPIPSVNGYANLGDCAVIIAGFLLGPFYGGVAAAVGSSLSDLILGYALYIPATFVIKGLCAAIASALYRTKANPLNSVISGIVSEIIMILGYYLYDSIFYGLSGALGAVLGNIVQAVFAVAVSSVVITSLKKTGKDNLI